MTPDRPVVMGTKNVVAAGHYLAAHAGFEILEAGGNAVDAGVAAGIAIGVLEPNLVNFAGVAPIMIYLAESREILTISGLGTWPRAATCQYFLEKHGGAIPENIERTVVPAAPDAWITALEHFGTMSFAEVASAAIRFAKEGFPAYPLMSEMLGAAAPVFREWPSSATVLLPGGRAPEPGEIFIQSDLARTLQYLADEESAAAGKGRRAEHLAHQRIGGKAILCESNRGARDLGERHGSKMFERRNPRIRRRWYDGTLDIFGNGATVPIKKIFAARRARPGTQTADCEYFAGLRQIDHDRRDAREID